MSIYKLFGRKLHHILLVLQELFWRVLTEGFFIRGALVQLYHDDQTLFGEALVHAFRLEMDVVRFLRIMISSDVLSDMRGPLSARRPLSNYALQAEDGPWFLHTFAAMDQIIMLPNDEDKRAPIKYFEKLHWFSRYWNMHARRGGVQPITRPTFDGTRTMEV